MTEATEAATKVRTIGPVITLVVADYCGLCGDTGRSGRDPTDGTPIFCTCGTGLRANLDYLSDLMQEYAAYLARVDALAKVRDLTPFEVQAQETTAFCFEVVRDEHDRIEVRYHEMQHSIPF